MSRVLIPEDKFFDIHYSILIEGLDGTGKTSVVKALVDRIKKGSSKDAITMKTPLKSIQGIRDYCVNQNPHMREGYYMTGNYLVSELIKCNISNGNTVVIDRYYPSTEAYIVGKDLSKDVSTFDSKWPEFLLKPDFMFILISSNELRKKRIVDRGDMNAEEKFIFEHPDIPSRINQLYINMGCIPIYIDESLSVEDIVDKIMNFVYYGIEIKYPCGYSVDL